MADSPHDPARPDVNRNDVRGSARSDRADGAHHRREDPAANDTAPEAKKQKSFWRELPILVVVALALSFLLQTFVARVYLIPSESMEPTLHGCPGCTGDRIVVEKVGYRFTDPRPPGRRSGPERPGQSRTAGQSGATGPWRRPSFGAGRLRIDGRRSATRRFR